MGRESQYRGQSGANTGASLGQVRAGKGREGKGRPIPGPVWANFGAKCQSCLRVHRWLTVMQRQPFQLVHSPTSSNGALYGPGCAMSAAKCQSCVRVQPNRWLTVIQRQPCQRVLHVHTSLERCIVWAATLLNSFAQPWSVLLIPYLRDYMLARFFKELAATSCQVSTFPRMSF